jgi:hypothetical protein
MNYLFNKFSSADLGSAQAGAIFERACRCTVSALVLLSSGCISPGDGSPPEPAQVYFPVGLAVDETSEHLIVVNSDFDLRFNQGTLQSLSIERLRSIAPTPCSTNSDCGDDDICDTEPTEENRERPSFFCVSAGTQLPCEGIGEKPDPELAVAPGRCSPIELDNPPFPGGPLLLDVVETTAFATQGLLLTRPCRAADGAARPCTADDSAADRIPTAEGVDLPHRLMLPIRGDTSIRYVEFGEDGRFECGREIESMGGDYREAGKEGADPNLLRCANSYRVEYGTTYGLNKEGEIVITTQPPDPREDEDEEKKNKNDPSDQFRLQPEPYDITSTDDDQLVVISHQTDARASTLFNDWQGKPHLIYILEQGLSENPIGVAALPGNADEAPSFLLTYRTDPRVDLLQFIDDGLMEAFSLQLQGKPVDTDTAKTFRPLLAPLASTAITTNVSGMQSRGVLVDDSARVAEMGACGDDQDCLQVASQTALDVYVANRSPNSLLLGRTAGSDPEAQVSQLPDFYDNVPLTAGPSRIVKGHVTDAEGEKQLRIFILCFDSALIYVFNPRARRVESVIRTGRGPYSLAFDTNSSLAFVGHFTDSYVGVVSLDMAHPHTFGETLLTVGVPQPPRANQ